MTFDLVVRNGTVVAGDRASQIDIGVVDGKIAALAQGLSDGREVFDASGFLVLPGGIDGHCHVNEPPIGKVECVDSFATGSLSAAFGGNTTFIPFVNQERGKPLTSSITEHRSLAAEQSFIDFGFHSIISDPSPAVLEEELPKIALEGCPSFKVFMCYDDVKLDDGQILGVMNAAQENKALVMLHAENDRAINWSSERLTKRGRVELKYFSQAHNTIVEREAVHRAISLAELSGARILIVHVSCDDAIGQIMWGRSRGMTVYAETCPQYLTFTEHDLDKPGWEAAKLICSPPPRTVADRAALWSAVEEGKIDLISSDHCAFNFEGPTGKRCHAYEGGSPHFAHIPPGIPGIETRLPLMFSAGVSQGRIDVVRFAELTATNVAKIHGLYPRKGTIAVGSDADIAVWDPDKIVRIKSDDLHDACDYSPYEDIEVKGWPISTILRGKTIIDNGHLTGRPGYGMFLKRELSGF